MKDSDSLADPGASKRAPVSEGCECLRCGGPTTGQDIYDGRHRYFPDCIAYLKAELAARPAAPSTGGSAR
jgi:hypothetical protein